MNKFIKEFVKNEDGVTTLEYVALAFCLLVAILVAARALGGTTSGRFNRLNNEMSQNN